MDSIPESHMQLYYTAVEKGVRNSECEPTVMQSASTAYHYARDVIKGRWPEAEPAILHDTYYVCRYARDVIKGRWPEAESTIIQDAKYVYLYARCVMRNRWIECEELVAKSDWKKEYIEYFFSEPIVTKDEVDIIQWQRKKLPGYFAPASLFEDKVSFLDIMVKE